MNYSQTASEVIECMAYISRETLQVFPRGIAGGEMGILINLSGSESERTPGELSRIMNVSTGRVASALKSLEKKKYIDSRHLVLTSVHPSPLSAYRGFFGSKPFSKTNSFLIKNDMTPIDWSNPDV